MSSARSKVKLSSSWPGRVLVVTLDHVQAQGAAVLDDPVDDGLELGELVDVVAVGLGHAFDRRGPVRVGLEPHHLGLAPHLQAQPGLGGELLVDAVEVAPAVRGEEGARVLELLPAPEQGAEHPGHLVVPRQSLEGLHVGEPDQLGRLGPVPDVLAVPVDEQVGGSPVDQLESLSGHRRPVGGRDPLAHDPTGDRDELEVDEGDAVGVDAAADLLDVLVPAVLFDETLEVGGHRTSLSYPGHGSSGRNPVAS